MTMPLFTATGVPKHVPIFLALAFAFVVTPLVPEVALPEQIALLLMGVVSEFLIGALLGSTVYTMFAAIATGTQIMAVQGGLGMASMPNPMVKGQGSALSTMASWMSGLVFLGMGLHYKFIAILIESFRVIAPGDGGMRIFNIGPTLIYVVGRMIEVGVSLSGPVLGMVFIVNLFIAIMSKLAPKMNMFFSVGFTLSSGFAMMLYGISLTWLVAAHSSEMAHTPEYVIRCLEAMR